ncbi:hypothetical protein Tco_1037863 [Tanacetum coccineum]
MALNTVVTVKSALQEFSGVSGLMPSMEKSVVFFGNVSEHVKASILEVMPFKVGSLPIRYLGVPLISTRMYKEHCSSLVDKVKKRLQDWKNKSLSFAGRLQLLKSVIGSIQVYWSFVFILPKSVSYDIEKLMRGFLWSHGELQKALMSKHIWNIVSKKDSLWVKWVNSYRLLDRRSNERNLWDLPILNDVCWGWKKILQCRDVIRNHIVTCIGDGTSTSVWFDNWLFLGPLCQFITNRDMFEAGLSLSCKVSDIVVNGEWRWPQNWDVKFPFLAQLPPPLIFHDRKDKVKLKVPWYKLV